MVNKRKYPVTSELRNEGLKKIKAGEVSKTIARILEVSEGTVEYWARNLDYFENQSNLSSAVMSTASSDKPQQEQPRGKTVQGKEMVMCPEGHQYIKRLGLKDKQQTKIGDYFKSKKNIKTETSNATSSRRSSKSTLEVLRMLDNGEAAKTIARKHSLPEEDIIELTQHKFDIENSKFTL